MKIILKVNFNFFIKNIRYKYKINKPSIRNNSQCTGFPKNLVFFGTDDFALTSLKLLILKKNEGLIDNLHIVTTIKKPYSEVASFCMTSKMPMSNWPLETTLKGFDMGIVVSFGHLIPQTIINSFPLGIWNVHGSLLPRWRGPSPIIHAVLNGDKHTGITIMRIHPHRFDTGEIIFQEKQIIPKDMKSKELTKIMAELGADCLVSCLKNTHKMNEEAKVQPNVGITKAPKIKEVYSEIIWNLMTPTVIKSMFCAFDDCIPLWSTWHSSKVKLRKLVNWHYEDIAGNEDTITDMYKHIKQLRVKSTDDPSTNPEKAITRNPDFFSIPGQVQYLKNQKVLRVKCLRGHVDFAEIIVKGRKAMTAQEFNNGFISKLSKNKHYFQ